MLLRSYNPDTLEAFALLGWVIAHALLLGSTLIKHFHQVTGYGKLSHPNRYFFDAGAAFTSFYVFGLLLQSTIIFDSAVISLLLVYSQQRCAFRREVASCPNSQQKRPARWPPLSTTNIVELLILFWLPALQSFWSSFCCNYAGEHSNVWLFTSFQRVIFRFTPMLGVTCTTRNLSGPGLIFYCLVCFSSIADGHLLHYVSCFSLEELSRKLVIRPHHLLGFALFVLGRFFFRKVHDILATNKI